MWKAAIQLALVPVWPVSLPHHSVIENIFKLHTIFPKLPISLFIYHTIFPLYLLLSTISILVETLLIHVYTLYHRQILRAVVNLATPRVYCIDIQMC